MVTDKTRVSYLIEHINNKNVWLRSRSNYRLILLESHLSFAQKNSPFLFIEEISMVFFLRVRLCLLRASWMCTASTVCLVKGSGWVLITSKDTSFSGFTSFSLGCLSLMCSLIQLFWGISWISVTLLSWFLISLLKSSKCCFDLVKTVLLLFPDHYRYYNNLHILPPPGNICHSNSSL